MNLALVDQEKNTNNVTAKFSNLMMMKIFAKCLFVVLLFSMMAIKINAQGYQPEGVIITEMPTNVEMLIQKSRFIHQNNPSIKGYRIQIVQSRTREKVYEAEAKIKEQFYELPTFVTYVQPDFKLRVGAFADKREAFAYLKKLKKEFQGAFIIQDQIALREIP